MILRYKLLYSIGLICNIETHFTIRHFYFMFMLYKVLFCNYRNNNCVILSNKQIGLYSVYQRKKSIQNIVTKTDGKIYRTNPIRMQTHSKVSC